MPSNFRQEIQRAITPSALRHDMFRLLIGFVILATCTSCAQQEVRPSTDDQEFLQVALLHEAYDLIHTGDPARAIEEFIDPVLSDFSGLYDDEETQYYCARDSAESLLYLVMAASEEQSAVVLSSTWADAHFLKGFALVELGRFAEARQSLEQAVALSPQNSQYVSELGHTFQAEERWLEALEVFERSEKMAQAFSPDDAKAFELGVARRSAGYVLVELGRLDEAEEKYLQCLEDDPDDEMARSELEYVRNLKLAE